MTKQTNNVLFTTSVYFILTAGYISITRPGTRQVHENLKYRKWKRYQDYNRSFMFSITNACIFVAVDHILTYKVKSVINMEGFSYEHLQVDVLAAHRFISSLDTTAMYMFHCKHISQNITQTLWERTHGMECLESVC